MKNCIFLIVLSIVLLTTLCNCQKKNTTLPPQDTSNAPYCLIKQVNKNGSPFLSNTYDSQHRLLKQIVLDNGLRFTYTYSYLSNNLVLEIDSNYNVLMSKTYIYLDANGKAKKTVREHYGTTPPDPVSDAIDTTYYLYDKAGFLRSEYHVWEHRNNPYNIYRAYDTTLYTIQNDDLIQMTNLGSTKSIWYFDYSDKPNTMDIWGVLLGNMSPIEDMFGRKNKHLYTSITIENQAYSFNYQFNNENLPTQFSFSSDSASIYNIIDYECIK